MIYRYPSGTSFRLVHRCSPTLWHRQWGVKCIIWGEVDYVGGEVECVGQEKDLRLQIESRFHETLWWKSNWLRWNSGWLLSCEFRFENSPLRGSRYYNCLLLRIRALLSVELLKRNGNRVKNLPTQWRRLGRKTGRSPRTSQPHREADESPRSCL